MLGQRGARSTIAPPTLRRPKGLVHVPGFQPVGEVVRLRRLVEPVGVEPDEVPAAHALAGQHQRPALLVERAIRVGCSAVVGFGGARIALGVAVDLAKPSPCAARVGRDRRVQDVASSVHTSCNSPSRSRSRR